MPAEIMVIPSMSQHSARAACTAARMGDEVQNPPGRDPSPALDLKHSPGLGEERRLGEGEGEGRGNTTCVLI